ncbi:hypothetical protein N0V93_009799 [Gnomoniopsis smithogilvyi]|uniref:Uncharacterized protein n=1 Tax=Gnomoniopsis smithogilvyi TaxID=1191159 RepID=A0A9W8YNJ2_9PEZI|nr:hypothetical protein N0V93_009799 [Gnomoniopsis smithogilvyi]
MTPPVLTPPKSPLAVRPEHVASHQTSLRLKQNGSSWSRGDFTVTCEDRSHAHHHERQAVAEPLASSSRHEVTGPGKKSHNEEHPILFSVKGKVLSLSQKRTLLDISGLPLFDIFREKWSYDWVIQLPGASWVKPLARLSLSRPGVLKRTSDVTVYCRDDKTVELRVQDEDIWRRRLNVYLGDKVIITAKRTDKMTPYIPCKGYEWIVDVAEGVDTSLATAIMVVLATTIGDAGTLGVGGGAGGVGG